MKNLLHLGEDRYLTTLLLKHFPVFKTQFVRDAHAYTVAPDDWKVLLSQRRRWINSTVHNLGELVFLEQLCGFCCFSMRFIVMIDLLSTLVQPVTVAYVSYSDFTPLKHSFILITSTDCVPAVSRHRTRQIHPYVVTDHDRIYLWCPSSGLHHEAQVGYDWLDDLLHPRNSGVLFLLATVLILANGRFLMGTDSCSPWRVREEDDRPCKCYVYSVTAIGLICFQDEGKFDPRSIPLKSWNDYVSHCIYKFLWQSNVSIQENELWDKESNHSIGSWVPPAKAKNEGYAESRTASLYGRETYYEPRSFSPAPSQLGMYPPPGYQSGRNTPQSLFHPMVETALLQPSASRPVTNYLDIPIPGTRSPEDIDALGGSPSDLDLERAVQDVLRSADLNSITKREIRRQLESHFGMDLTSRKGVINASIDRALLDQN